MNEEQLFLLDRGPSMLPFIVGNLLPTTPLKLFHADSEILSKTYYSA